MASAGRSRRSWPHAFVVTPSSTNGATMRSEPETAPETTERKTVRRKRFQRGCVRKVKHGRRWIWIGKYREDGIGRTKVLGHCADLTEGGAWAKLQEELR